MSEKNGNEITFPIKPLQTPASSFVHVAIQAQPQFPLTLILNKMQDFEGEYISSLAMQLPPPKLALPGSVAQGMTIAVHMFKVRRKTFEAALGAYDPIRTYPIEALIKEIPAPRNLEN